MTIALEPSGSRRYFRVFTGLMWLAVPAIGGLYAMSWRELPARLATHFDLANQPNGWMSREAALAFLMVMGIFMAGLATLILARVKKPDPAAWALLLLFYVILGTLLWAGEAIIAYNVHGQPVNVAPVLVSGMGAAILVVITALSTKRSVQLPASKVLAAERHNSPKIALILGVATVLMIAVIAAIPVAGIRFALGVAVILMLASAALAWDGFRYLFSPSGVEVRALGFRLRSIPAADIKSYAIDRWNVIGGYGIRGVGDKRAYVWGNRGVLIKTLEGEVFLGHDRPEQIIRDLDLITGNHEARGAAFSS
ncbi:MAG TPA: DUF1648 domain-containing protein [Terriglobales bacterium]|jgi:hypothetical protein|nr:DUF1648 domain-containing protein [Terriglobales bacterium]